jgi:hypothetical protein
MSAVRGFETTVAETGRAIECHGRDGLPDPMPSPPVGEGGAFVA